MKNLDEFYFKTYLPAHTKPLTRAAHSIGFSLMIAGIFTSAACLSVWPLIIGVILNLIFTVGSHIFIEKNLPVFAKTPQNLIYAVVCEARLWWNIT